MLAKLEAAEDDSKVGPYKIGSFYTLTVVVGFMDMFDDGNRVGNRRLLNVRGQSLTWSTVSLGSQRGGTMSAPPRRDCAAPSLLFVVLAC